MSGKSVIKVYNSTAEHRANSFNLCLSLTTSCKSKLQASSREFLCSIPDEDCWFCLLYWRLCWTESAAAILPPLSSSERTHKDRALKPRTQIYLMEAEAKFGQHTIRCGLFPHSNFRIMRLEYTWAELSFQAILPRMRQQEWSPWELWKLLLSTPDFHESSAPPCPSTCD